MADMDSLLCTITREFLTTYPQTENYQFSVVGAVCYQEQNNSKTKRNEVEGIISRDYKWKASIVLRRKIEMGITINELELTYEHRKSLQGRFDVKIPKEAVMPQQK